MAHLSKMRAAGITHLHLLPSYDYGSVPEREEEQARIQVGPPAAVSLGSDGSTTGDA
jgi:hypothetical protein